MPQGALKNIVRDAAVAHRVSLVQGSLKAKFYLLHRRNRKGQRACFQSWVAISQSQGRSSTFEKRIGKKAYVRNVATDIAEPALYEARFMSLNVLCILY